jgi:predicted GNAT family N-acyltransferase
VEQNCVYQDMDGKEMRKHYILLVANMIIKSWLTPDCLKLSDYFERVYWSCCNSSSAIKFGHDMMRQPLQGIKTFTTNLDHDFGTVIFKSL